MKHSKVSQSLPSELADVEVVMVSYRSRDHVADLLASWPVDLAVTIVDNSCNSDGIRDLATTRTSVRYLDGGGQGFARAANMGAQHATAQFVVFVNPDSRPTAEQIATLVGGIRSDPSAVTHAGAPMIPNGEVEIGAGGWEPSIRRVLVYSIGLERIFTHSGFFARPAPDERMYVDWVGGACMAVRREQFLTMGGFDETFYVYAEDMSFGRRARDMGLRSVLRTDITVPHSAGSSGAPSREMLRLRGASFAGYVMRYHRLAPALMMRGILATGALARSGLQLLKGDRSDAQLYLALVMGTLTRRAYVGGVEVARSRFIETESESGGSGGTGADSLG
jgi:GT2 family glycosyltransferase